MPLDNENMDRRRQRREEAKKKQRAQQRRLVSLLVVAGLVLMGCGIVIYRIASKTPESQPVSAVATTVGTNTVGKGYYQNLFQLEDGSAVDLSVGRYFTSKGENLEGVGLTPDVEVDLSDEDYAALYYGTLAQEDDAQLQAAVELLMENVVTP